MESATLSGRAALPEALRKLAGLTGRKGLLVIFSDFLDDLRETFDAVAIFTHRGFETIVFHANGAGGRAMEAMIEDGSIDGVIDATTAELTAELFGGVLSSGPNRMEMAGRRGIPQVISTGALEVINFGPRDTLPARWAAPERSIVIHNPSITSVRLTADEAATAGRFVASKLSAGTGPVSVLLPRGGCTKYELPGGPWTDPAIDHAMFDAIRSTTRDGIDCRDVDGNLNDASFADEAVAEFLACWVQQRALPAAEPPAVG